MSRYRISEDELIEEMNRLSGEIGSTPTMEDMRKFGGYTFDTYQNRFGSWNEAVRVSGLKPNNEVDIPDSDVIDDIERVSEEFCGGGSPTSVDMKEHGEYSERIYLFNDTSWEEFLEESGFKSKYRVSRKELISAIHRLADEIEKTPSSREMRKHGEYTPDPYRRAFGTWAKALEEAGYKPVSYISGEEHPNWKGGIDESERRKYQNWSKRVKARDGYECQRCTNPRSRARFAHHIKRRDEYPELAFEEENGLTLCADCHAEIHENDREYNSLTELADKLAEEGVQGVYHE